MTQVAERTSVKDLYVAEFERRRDLRSSGEPEWLRQLRARAIARFAERGFPTTREEDWRFTSVAPLAERAFRPAPAGLAGVTNAMLAPYRLPEAAGAQIVVVNGRFAPELSTLRSLPRGLRVSDMRSVLTDDPRLVEPYLGRLADIELRSFAALNSALFEDGAFVAVADGAIIEQPVHVLFVATGSFEATVNYPRLLVVAGEHSQVRLIESYAGPGDEVYFTDAVSELVVGPRAVVDHYKVQRESARGYHVGLMQVRLERNSTFSSHSIALGAALGRNDVVSVLDGEGGECTLNGLYLVDGQRLTDNHTTIDHAKPHCDSHEVYKGILSGQARAVFNGKIIVRPDAQKTDAKQTNRALLLSDDAQIDTKPQLEIFADDVKCTHGAAVGQLDAEAIFYLRARGLDLPQARALLVQAFAGDILSRVRIEPLRAELEATMLARLPGASAA